MWEEKKCHFFSNNFTSDIKKKRSYPQAGTWNKSATSQGHKTHWWVDGALNGTCSRRESQTKGTNASHTHEKKKKNCMPTAIWPHGGITSLVLLQNVYVANNKRMKKKNLLLNELNSHGYKRTVVGNELRNQSAPEGCWKECMQCIINILMKQATSRRCTQNSPGALKPGQSETSFVVEKRGKFR